MAIIDLSLPHCDELDGLANAVMETQGFKTAITRHYVMPKTERDVVFVDSWLSMFAHCGTHLDCPRHISQSVRTVDQMPLDQFMGEACVLDFSSKGSDDAITAAELEHFYGLVREEDIALVHTGWSDKHWSSYAYLYHSLFLAGDGARWFVDKKVKAVGFDCLQEEEVKKIPDNVPEDYVVHRTLLGAGIVQIEHMTNLGAIPAERCRAAAFPLKLIGVEGSPTRAVAWVD